ncbi:MAG TPA: bifunctional helix-turn-helix domain-containing protein/methylated-DNA--[protein]-cysteine S-methyltransferase [Thermohalobaculum sp.]|nr:bifunctional helix-turn-helix domain-containing protein/methylated-DNA--[protein]-cysteine S-methyltransferase [Thermohalobaculum sp.]
MTVQKPESSFHYELMAAAIAWLEEHREDRPSLEALAAAMGMSPTHFQRLFGQWVGVSPKKYVEYLTLEHARALLAARQPVLEAAHGAGASGPGRLHDLFLRWEGMTPGEYARRGGGLTIRWGWFDSPFGRPLAMATDRGLSGLAFAAELGADATMADMTGRWPAATFAEDAGALRPMVDAAFSGRGTVPLAPLGGPFQIKVWEALVTLPPGTLATYSDIARAIGSPSAVRAVGTAVGRNPVAWLIPCHRVLRRDGGLGGYHWGLPVKRAMLAWEGARAEAARKTAA